MPELPEVETMCRGIATICGRKIASVTLPPCTYRPIPISPDIEAIHRHLSRQSVTGVSRLGKRVLIHAGGWTLILQPKMTGLVALDAPPDEQHLRLQIDFSGRPGLRLLFWDRRGLGTVELVRAEEVAERIVRGRLGPDALEITLDEFKQRFAGTQRAIKVALLDQKMLAGVGNLYASEMLHVARIHPMAAGNSLSGPQMKRLCQSMHQILTDAIFHEGSTLSDGTYRNTLNDPGGYQNYHRVYGRADQLCLTCGKANVVRIVQAQRSTFFCPQCQPLRNKGKLGKRS